MDLNLSFHYVLHPQQNIVKTYLNTPLIKLTNPIHMYVYITCSNFWILLARFFISLVFFSSKPLMNENLTHFFKEKNNILV